VRTKQTGPLALALVAVACVLVCARTARGGQADTTAPPPAPESAQSGEGGGKAAPPPGGSIVPKPQPLVPRPFTLEDRYLDAARRGDLEMLKLCLDKGVDAGAKDGFARSALLLAARDGRSLEMVRFLQARGLAIDDADVRGITALGYAAGNGQVELMSYLIEQGAAPDRRDAQGQTPLFHAALSGHERAVARLLGAGVDVDSQDRFGDTPLMGACAKGYDAIARMLVDAGADASLRDQEGRTARERAAKGAAFCRGLGSEPPEVE
jgi:hypothetical protein